MTKWTLAELVENYAAVAGELSAEDNEFVKLLIRDRTTQEQQIQLQQQLILGLENDLRHLTHNFQEKMNQLEGENMILRDNTQAWKKEKEFMMARLRKVRELESKLKQMQEAGKHWQQKMEQVELKMQQDEKQWVEEQNKWQQKEKQWLQEEKQWQQKETQWQDRENKWQDRETQWQEKEKQWQAKEQELARKLSNLNADVEITALKGEIMLWRTKAQKLEKKETEWEQKYSDLTIAHTKLQSEKKPLAAELRKLQQWKQTRKAEDKAKSDEMEAKLNDLRTSNVKLQKDKLRLEEELGKLQQKLSLQEEPIQKSTLTKRRRQESEVEHSATVKPPSMIIDVDELEAEPSKQAKEATKQAKEATAKQAKEATAKQAKEATAKQVGANERRLRAVYDDFLKHLGTVILLDNVEQRMQKLKDYPHKDVIATVESKHFEIAEDLQKEFILRKYSSFLTDPDKLGKRDIEDVIYIEEEYPGIVREARKSVGPNCPKPAQSYYKRYNLRHSSIPWANDLTGCLLFLEAHLKKRIGLITRYKSPDAVEVSWLSEDARTGIFLCDITKRDMVKKHVTLRGKLRVIKQITEKLSFRVSIDKSRVRKFVNDQLLPRHVVVLQKGDIILVASTEYTLKADDPVRLSPEQKALLVVSPGMKCIDGYLLKHIGQNVFEYTIDMEVRPVPVQKITQCANVEFPLHEFDFSSTNEIQFRQTAKEKEAWDSIDISSKAEDLISKKVMHSLVC
jgi:hypothetical protein